MPLYKIPNINVQVEFEYLAAYLQDFNHSFYVNLDNPISDSDFDNWEVGLFNTEGNEVQNFGNPTKDIISGSEYRFYFSTVINSSHSGVHFFAVYNSNDNSVKYQSNFFKVISVDEIENYAFLQFRNSSNLDNFNYETLSITNSVFLDLDQIDFQYEYELQSYREQSTGKFRRQKNQKNKVIKLETYLFDEASFDAMYSLCDHDEITINGDEVVTKTGSNPDTQRDMNIHKGSVEFYITRYGTVNLKG